MFSGGITSQIRRLEERLLDADAALSDALKSNKASHKAAAANAGRPGVPAATTAADTRGGGGGGGGVFFTDEHDPTATRPAAPPATAKPQSLLVATAAAVTGDQPAATTAAGAHAHAHHHRVPSAWGPAPAKGDADGITTGAGDAGMMMHSEGVAATTGVLPGRATVSSSSARPASAAYAASTWRGVEQQPADDATFDEAFEVASVGDSEVSSSGEDEMAFADPDPSLPTYTSTTAPPTHTHAPAPPVYHRGPEPPVAHRALDFNSHAVTDPHNSKNNNAPGAGGVTAVTAGGVTATAATGAVRDEFDAADPLLQRVALTGGAPPVVPLLPVASAVVQQQQQQQQQPDYAKTVFAPRPNLNSVPGLLNNTSELLQEVHYPDGKCERTFADGRRFRAIRERHAQGGAECALGRWHGGVLCQRRHEALLPVRRPRRLLLRRGECERVCVETVCAREREDEQRQSDRGR